MKNIYFYAVFTIIYFNFYLSLFTTSFSPELTSSILLLTSPILGIWTFMVLSKLDTSNENEKLPLFNWIWVIVLLLWFQILIGINDYLPSFLSS